MRKPLYLSRVFIVAFLLVWGLYTKAHPGYDMFLCGEKIGFVKNKTQAEDILEIIRHETDQKDLPASLYLRLFKAPPSPDAVKLLENARQVIGSSVLPDMQEEKVPEEEPKSVEVSTPHSAFFAAPLSFDRITSAFGMRDGRMHEGVDLAAQSGTPIMAAAGGTVTFSGNVEGYGKLIILSHDNDYESYYAHCSVLYASLGDSVSQGDVIAEVGSTGKSTGPHLHFEIRKGGSPLDPMPHLGEAFT